MLSSIRLPYKIKRPNVLQASCLALAQALSPQPAPLTNTVSTIIRIQVRDQMDSDEWFELVVFKSRTPYKFFRVLFETEAPE
jgi:hypothetical protein